MVYSNKKMGGAKTKKIAEIGLNLIDFFTLFWYGWKLNGVW